MPLTLHWKGSTTLPVEAEGLRPEDLSPLSAAEVAGRPVPLGKTYADLGDLFRVEGNGADGHLVFEGDLRHVRKIGAGMTSGRLTIRGDVGPHLGAGMLGGSIDLLGSAGPWAGAEMSGGRLSIKGSAGDDLGSAYPGSRRGMREGMILVEGSIGQDAGVAMRRGLIAVNGPTGDGLGRGMIAGSIFAFGLVGRYPGAGMKRGTIALFADDKDAPILPTFRLGVRYRPPFATLYLRALTDRGFPVPQTAFDGSFDRYNGDVLNAGQGEILRWTR
ncbi:formylmethanofuran dehydrogenase subunit C [soil metagenome]